MSLVVAKNVSKSFKERVLWSNLNFSVEQGQIVSLQGQSGSGKTTLLNCIGALADVDSGELTVDGVSTYRLKGRRRRLFFRDKVSFLFQNYALIEPWTVARNLRMVLKVTGGKDRRAEVLERVGLLDKMNKPVYTLSGGEQQRVALARVMLKPGKVILTDEPTAALDDGNASNLLDILQDLAKGGACVVVATHDPRVLKRADQQLRLTQTSEEELLLAR